MTVLAQIFNIMPPDLQTLTFEISGDYEGLAGVFKERASMVPAWSTIEDVYPTPDLVTQYLEKPSAEDTKLTQLDVLKSNSIDIFYSLLMVQSNTLNMKAFLTSEQQKLKGYPFFANLCRHMLYSSQMGLRVSICEFLKDLISHEASFNSTSQGKFTDIPNRRYILSEVLLSEVVSRMIQYFDEDSTHEPTRKSIEHSKCLVL